MSQRGILQLVDFLRAEYIERVGMTVAASAL
jgi:hypothetical protein